MTIPRRAALFPILSAALLPLLAHAADLPAEYAGDATTADYADAAASAGNPVAVGRIRVSNPDARGPLSTAVAQVETAVPACVASASEARRYQFVIAGRCSASGCQMWCLPEVEDEVVVCLQSAVKTRVEKRLTRGDLVQDGDLYFRFGTRIWGDPHVNEKDGGKWD